MKGKKFLILTFALFLVFVVFISCNNSKWKSLEGTVFCSSSPMFNISGVNITITNGPVSYTTVSDGNGKYKFTSIETLSNPWTITATHVTHANYTAIISLESETLHSFPMTCQH